MLTGPRHPYPVMDPAAIASALIAARMGQVQMAAAAQMMRNAHSMDAAAVQQLLAAANQSGDKLAAAVHQGMGEFVDIFA